MTKDEIRAAILRILCQIAPEADPTQLIPNVSLREQLDIDSMDFLNFMIGLHKEFGVEIPEVDYARLLTVDGCTDYMLATAANQGERSADGP